MDSHQSDGVGNGAELVEGSPKFGEWFAIWHGWSMTTPTITLELRCIEIPRSPLIERLEREMGRPFRHEYRHFLAGEPVACGTILQCFLDGKWITGRYEWSCRREDLPALHIDERVIPLTWAPAALAEVTKLVGRHWRAPASTRSSTAFHPLLA